MNRPCMNCTKRYLGCQDVKKCKEYKEYKDTLEVIRTSERAERESERTYFELKDNLLRRKH